ncbi:ribonuclease H, partial [Trifolium medium]|nr:ribonuclease H [Trifolium medium]
MNNSTQQIIDTTLTVKDALTESGDWDTNFLTTHLPLNIINQVMAIPAPKETDGPNSIRWRGTNTRRFTFQSAYNLQREHNLSTEG